ncbi:MAG: carboxypeptidase regulatory-like domain-containing protein [Saprospiraceae bacterium]|nr:carboxypeptidase regulatory-like domain-containing protein [Saprospiraceae bacterium]
MITLKEYCFLVLLCILFSCRKDSVETTITNPNIDPKRLVETTVSGLVLDEQGFPIQDAKVTVGAIYSSSTVTDQNGYFKFTGFATKENGVIKIEKEQFFTSYVNISTNAKDTSRVKVLLRNLGSGTQIRGIEGGKVEVKNFGSVEFEPESFLDSEGKIYKGQVKVFFRGIDPFDQNLAKYIPAEMLSINANQDVQRLQSYGMVDVIIKAENDQELTLQKQAKLEIQVPQQQINSAPSSMPLWYLNDSSGFWVEEGRAFLEGNKYIGYVNHFTPWNCDTIVNSFIVEGNIHVGTYHPEVELIYEDEVFGTKSILYPNTSGYFSYRIQSGGYGKLKIINDCDEIILQKEIPTVNARLNLGVLNLDEKYFSKISGTIVDCGFEPIKKGYVMIKLNDNAIPIFISGDQNGKFDAVVSNCHGFDNAYLIAYDALNNKQSKIIEFNSSDQLDFGLIRACDQSYSEGIYMFFEDGSHKILEPAVVDLIVKADSLNRREVFNIYAVDSDGQGGIAHYNVQLFRTRISANIFSAWDLSWTVNASNNFPYCNLIQNNSRFQILSLSEIKGEFVNILIKDASLNCGVINQNEIKKNVNISIKAKIN